MNESQVFLDYREERNLEKIMIHLLGTEVGHEGENCSEIESKCDFTNNIYTCINK